jgi:tetratricopeptide (TPR) repeat protein
VAKVDDDVGLFEDARGVADEALKAADATGYAPLQGEALLQRGNDAIALGDDKEARAVLVRAEAAAIAGRHPEVAARALSGLLSADTREGRFEEAHDWAQLGEAAAAHAGPFARGELAEREGQLFYAERRYAEAQPPIERAIATWEGALGRDDPRLADPVTDLANVRLALGDYAGARRLNERAIDLVEKAYGRGNSLVASNVNNLGDGCLHSGDYECAVEAFQRAHDIYVGAHGRDFFATAITLHNLAEAWREKGMPQRALPLNLEAVATLERLYGEGDPYVAAALGGLAETYRAQGDVDRALATFERALAMREKLLGPDHADLAETLTGLGETWLEVGRLDRARPPLERALTLREAHPGDAYDAAVTRFALARALVDRARARELAMKARAELASAGPRGAARVAAVDAWLAASPP